MFVDLCYLDETSLQGRVRMKVYMPSKPAKFGLKVCVDNPSSIVFICWCLTPSFALQLYLVVDSQTQFILGVHVYGGAKVTGPEKDHGPNVVMKLVTPFFDKNHCVVVDNYFPSIKLAFDLMDKGTFLVATIRSNRTGLPDVADAIKRGRVASGGRGRGRGRRRKTASRLDTTPTNIPLAPPVEPDELLVHQPLTDLETQYSFRVWQHDSSPQLTVTLWNDRKPVLLISTATSPIYSGAVSRLQTLPVEEEKKQAAEEKQQRVKRPVRAPTSVTVYQQWMGAVDRVDQRLSYFRLSRARTRKYWKVLAFGIFDLAIHNTLVLYNRHVNKNISAKDFRLKLAKELIGAHASGYARSASTHRQRDEGHLPTAVSHEKRGYCKECRARCTIKCTGCDKFFCVLSERNCFATFHCKLFHS
jgi:hypothetical protein